jgi:hypothetical protein
MITLPVKKETTGLLLENPADRLRRNMAVWGTIQAGFGRNDRVIRVELAYVDDLTNVVQQQVKKSGQPKGGCLLS